MRSCCALVSRSLACACATWAFGSAVATAADLPAAPTATASASEAALSVDGDADTPENRARMQWNMHHDPVVGLHLLQVLIDAGKLEDARLLAKSMDLRLPGSAVVRAQLGYFWYMDNAYAHAQAEFEAALLGKEWTPEQVRNLRMALANSSEAAGDIPAAVAALQPLCAADDVDALLRLGRVYLVARNRPGALAAGRRVKAVARGEVDRAAGEALFQAAVQPLADPKGFNFLTAGYRHLRHGDDRQAMDAFARGFALGSGRSYNYADAGYAAKRLSNNATAVEWFRFSLDLDEEERYLGRQQVYGFRREIEVLERQFGALLGSPYQAAPLDVWQVGAEAYWQPPVIGERNGKTLRVAAGVFENLRNGPGGPVGAPTAQVFVALRYKPFTRHNWVLSAERWFAVGARATDDWILRHAWSTGSGLDLHVDRRWWPQWQVFAQGLWFLPWERLVVGAEGRIGATLSLPRWPALTLTPHALMALELDSAAQQRHVGALGPGLSVRLWFDQDMYRAPRRWLELHASYRWSYADRGEGPVLRATLSL